MRFDNEPEKSSPVAVILIIIAAAVIAAMLWMNGGGAGDPSQAAKLPTPYTNQTHGAGKRTP